MASLSNRRRHLPPPSATFVPEAGAEPLPGYRLHRLRGRGGFATVWEATNPAGQRVALKFMSSQTSNSTAREIRSLQAIHTLSHPSLLRTGQVWSVPGYIAIEMALAEASLLDLFLLYAEEFKTPVEPNKVCLYLYQAAQALDFLNARKHTFEGRTVGFVHGDIKPNNILLFGDEARLADYGLATPMLAANTPCPRAGTLEYAAPEVFQGNLTDNTDQFSLAVSYHLLKTGAFPYPPPPKTPGKSFYRPPPDLSLVSPEERPVLYRALSAVPQDRYPSCTVLMTQLMKALGLEVTHDPDRGMRVQPIPPPVVTGRSQMIRGFFADVPK